MNGVSLNFFRSGLFWFASVFSCLASDWQEWRGPTRNGHAATGENPPTQWSETKNIKWKTPVPGRGHSSPTVIENQIILTTADEQAQTQMVLSFDRNNGRQQWQTVVHQGNLPERIHKKNTHASPTATCDGEKIFVVFFNSTDVYLTALNREGAILWQVKTGEFHSKYPFGFAASPVLYKDSVIVTSEYEEGGYIAAFRKSDGSEIWRTPRTAGTSYSSPVVARVAGKEQLLISGQSRLSSYDPANGRELWHASGSSPATCGTMVWSGDTVFASGGFPNKETIAIRADGSGEVLWKNGEKCYEQSMLYVDGFLYALNDGGIAFCWNATTGEEMWKVRLRGPVSASPVYAGGKIYAVNEQGTCFVFHPDPSGYRETARNQLGESGFASPSIVDNRIYIRTAFHGQGGEEFLYCIGE
ncbi:MAG: PQQ-binding-like beta-propeller repeat protein [Verrucomicrobiales bacterium]|nr:PQQ-binding-like beta-propeller repeat protein [Verrucomicrobiales bacterium]